MAIYGVEGQFGSGKTSLAVFLTKKSFENSASLIARGFGGMSTIVISNIKMDKLELPNYVFMKDDELLRTLRTINAINDLERIVYSKFLEGRDIFSHQREKFTKFIMIIDESPALYNSQEWKELDKDNKFYIDQNRKNFLDIYLCGADGNSNVKSLRKYVAWWYYVKPYWPGVPILQDIGIIRRMQKDEDGLPAFKYGYNSFNQLVKVPIDEYRGWFYKPLVRRFYDDLYKNIPDDKKYTDMDFDLFLNIISKKPELLKPMGKFIEPFFDKIPLKYQQSIIEVKSSYDLHFTKIRKFYFKYIKPYI